MGLSQAELICCNVQSHSIPLAVPVHSSLAVCRRREHTRAAVEDTSMSGSSVLPFKVATLHWVKIDMKWVRTCEPLRIAALAPRSNLRRVHAVFHFRLTVPLKLSITRHKRKSKNLGRLSRCAEVSLHCHVEKRLNMTNNHFLIGLQFPEMKCSVCKHSDKVTDPSHRVQNERAMQSVAR